MYWSWNRRKGIDLGRSAAIIIIRSPFQAKPRGQTLLVVVFSHLCTLSYLQISGWESNCSPPQQGGGLCDPPSIVEESLLNQTQEENYLSWGEKQRGSAVLPSWEHQDNEAGEPQFLALGTKPAFFFSFAFPAKFLCPSGVWSETIMTSVLSLELIFNSFLNINHGQSYFCKRALLC